MHVLIPARERDRGFTLLETICALALATLVVGAISTAFYRTVNQALRLRDVTDRRQSARMGVGMMDREIRMAGSGWGRIPVYGNNSAGQPVTLAAVVPGHSAAPDDSLLLIGAWQTQTTVTGAMPSSSTNLKVADVNGFMPNDLVLVTNGVMANMMQVTGSNAPSGILQANPASAYNNPGGYKVADGHWPATGYPIGSMVFKLTVSSYYMDRTSFAKPALMRHEYGTPPQVAAYNVDGFRVWYQVQDGSWTRNPQNLMDVQQVMPVVATRLNLPRRPALVDSVWTALQPRSF